MRHVLASQYSLARRMQPWVVCLSASLFFFFIFIQMTLFNVLAPELFGVFHITVTQLGHLSATYFYGTVLFLLPAGILLDRYSTRQIILWVMGGSVLCTLGFALSSSFLQAAFFRFFLGTMGAFCLLSNVRLASRWFPPYRMALVTGLIVTVAMAGGLMAQTPAASLLIHYGVKQTLLWDACLGAIIFLIIFLFVKDTPAGQALIKPTIKFSEQFWANFYLTIKNPQNWLAGVYTSCMNLPIFLLGASYGVLYLIQVHQLTRVQATLVTSMIFFGMIIGCPIVGWISDQLRRRRLPMITGAITAVMVMLLVLYSSALSYLLLLIVFFILGFIISTQILSYPLVAESNSLDLTASAESLSSLLIMLGGFSQPVFGYLMKWNWLPQYREGVPLFMLHDYRLALLILPVAFVFALIAACCLRETHCKPLPGIANSK